MNRRQNKKYKKDHPEAYKQWYERLKSDKKRYAKYVSDLKARQEKLRSKGHTTCNIIKNHHEEMKDDPEHLTTEFIKKLINIKCSK